MPDLKPIPRPASQYWRDFRFHVAPFVVFICTCLAVVFMWVHNVSPSTLVGEAEPITAVLVSPDAGILTNLLVSRFQMVKAGEPLAEIISTDVRRFDSAVGLIRGEIAIAQGELDSAISRERLGMDYESLRNEYMRQKIDLASGKAELEFAERDFKIAGGLLEQKILSEIDYDYFAKIVAPLRARVEETAHFVEHLAQRVEAAKHLAGVLPSALSGENMAQATEAYERSKTNLQNVPSQRIILRAPIDGMITTLSNRAGENILPGAAVMTITAATPERIVGYLRQPFPFEPKEGMKVTIRCRSIQREEQTAQISAVGKSYEAITAPLMRPGVPHEMGLPIAVTIPGALKLRPGELVDLTIRR